MNLKKIIINSILIFLLCSGIHFLYELMPSFITSIFAPVNESIFEHLKLIFTSCILYTLISNIYYKDKDVFLISYLRGMFVIIIMLILYLPSRAIFGEIMVLTLIILFISIMLSEILLNKILNREYPILNLVSILLIILNFIIFGYLTYHPLHNDLFYDTKHKGYGIVKKD